VQVTELMSKCWLIDANDRPTFAQMYTLMVNVEIELINTGNVMGLGRGLL
jgi:hypothetical protein